MSWSAPTSPPPGAARAARCVHWPLGLAVASLLSASLVTGVAAAADGFIWTATVGGRSVDASTRSEPVQLVPGEPARIAVRLENRTTQPVRAPWVRLEGRVLGMSFYVYTTRVDLEALPGGIDERQFDVDLLDLDRQASGLIPSQIALLDARGEVLEAKPVVVDVRGSVGSVYGTFGLAVGAITVVLLVGALWRLSAGRLPSNRWRRAIVMAAPGLGIGFTLTFTLSVLRWALPSGPMWATLLLLGALVGFAAGYLSPNPRRDDDQTGGPGRGLDEDVFGLDEEEDQDAGMHVGAEQSWPQAEADSRRGEPLDRTSAR